MKEKLRILVAEGASGQAASVLRELFPGDQGGMELTEVSAVSTLMASLKLVSPEVILFELALGNPDLLGTVRLLHRTKPEVPLIVITDPSEKKFAVESLREGAMDYLLKDQMDAQTVGRVLRGALERNTLQGLADLLRDPLTGLYIRGGFLTLGSQVMESAKQRGGNLVLLCVMFENLKSITKDFGQNAAETYLREVATLLTRSFRKTDVIGRIGESQFAALAVNAVEPSVPVLLQRLRTRLQALNQGPRPQGPLELQMVARFWAGNADERFADFLDQVEAGLRAKPSMPEHKGKAGKMVEIAKE